MDASALRWGLGRGGGCHFQHQSTTGDGRDMEGEFIRQPACANGTALKVGTRAYMPGHDEAAYGKDPLAGVLGAARWHGGSDSSLTTSDFAAAGGALTSSASQPNAVGQLGEGGAFNPLFTFAFSPHRTGCITGWNNKMVTNTGGAEAYVAANVSVKTLYA